MKLTENTSVRDNISTMPDENPEQLKELIEQLRQAINRASDDAALIGTVNSVFRTQNVDETIAQLKYLNSGGQPQWAF